MINEKYSYRDFTGADLTAIDPAEFNDTEIVGSCFYREGQVNAHVFPNGMKGVTFIACNLDNVLVTGTNTIEPSCTHKKIKVQNDWDDWVLDDATELPIYPMNRRFREEAKLSVDPADIPATKWTKEERKAYKDNMRKKIFENERKKVQ